METQENLVPSPPLMNQDAAASLFCHLPTLVESLGQIQQVPTAALAYLGDAVYELYIRTRYIVPPKRPQTYHHQVVAQVRAERQAQHLRSLEPHLTSKELELVKRGRNAASGKPKRLDADVYQQATSLETLIGYLYLTDPHRLMQLLDQLVLDSNPDV